MIYRAICEREDLLCEAEELARIMAAWKQEIPVRIKTGILSTRHLVMIVPAPKEKGPLTDYFATIAPETKAPTPKEQPDYQAEQARPVPAKKPEFDPWKKIPVHK